MHIEYSVTISLKEEGKIKIFNALKVQEEVSLILKHLHTSFKAKKGERIGSNKSNSFHYPTYKLCSKRRKVVPYFTNPKY